MIVPIRFPAMRFYFSSRSYPELREHPGSAWTRGMVWIRALPWAVRDGRFWAVVASQLLLVVGGLALSRLAWIRLYEDRLQTPTGFRAPSVAETLLPMGILWLGVVLSGLVAASWGGDVFRPHLRRASRHARTACPSCGHDLSDREDWPADEVPCPECGETIPTSVFRSPYGIPRRFRAVGGSVGRRHGARSADSDD